MFFNYVVTLGRDNMRGDKRFRNFEPGQLLLLPPDLRDWLPDDHLAYFISDVVDTLDLSFVIRQYNRDEGGAPAYHPKMMMRLMIYSYCVGMASSRKIEKLTYESVPFRVLTGDQHPDHDTIADFRARFLPLEKAYPSRNPHQRRETPVNL
jgi:transposase